MKKDNERLWLKLNKIKKEIQHIRFYYAGTDDKEIIQDMISYLNSLIERLEKNE